MQNERISLETVYLENNYFIGYLKNSQYKESEKEMQHYKWDMYMSSTQKRTY